MRSVSDLFAHELKDIYTGEHLLVEALGQLEKESMLPDLAQAFSRHREETREHIKRLEQVAELIGKEVEEERCPGIEGLLEEKKLFAKEKPADEILNVFNVGAAQKTERYEITHYESLIELARKLGLDAAVPLLRQTLNEEESALKKLKGLEARMPMPETPRRGP